MKNVLAISGFVLMMALAAGRADAGPVVLTVGMGGAAGDHILGEVFTPNDLKGGLAARDEALIDALRTLGLGVRTTRTKGSVPGYYRSTTDFGTLPDAVQTGAVLTDTFIYDGTSVVRITLSSTFTYLVGAYDGPNGGAEIWYIGGFAPGTAFEIPRYAQPSGSPQNLIVSNKYGITSWTAFNPVLAPDPVPDPVPDGGSTAALLGLAMLGLGLAWRLKG